MFCPPVCMQVQAGALLGHRALGKAGPGAARSPARERSIRSVWGHRGRAGRGVRQGQLAVGGLVLTL